ncbi:hypothetical protein [Seonamhaeicola marinus]|uniref:Uncharacterized protein n=1 Tax=Seonamhaeicola marinus TaxID=1912246 RepID=A0A5D0IKM6_9FLAO|nr:hypothetical protein [Seonamhaeicola marinus]TYA84345.1 hypothetical protein FUA24_06780 [Seonamhaeicola marinus]
MITLNSYTLREILYLFMGLMFSCQLAQAKISNLVIDNYNTIKDAAVVLDSNPKEVNTKVIDTSDYVLDLLNKGVNFKKKGHYSAAYNLLWEALVIAEVSEENKVLAECHYEIGMLYEIFNNFEEAISHMTMALELRKELYNTEEISQRDLIRNYFGIAISYSRSENFLKAEDYLDSCAVIANRYKVNPKYIMAERANIAIKGENLDKAENLLNQVMPYFLERESPYKVMVDMFMGNLKMKQNMFDEAQFHYNRGLINMDKYDAHINFKPIILQELSKIYEYKGDAQKAYEAILKAKESNDLLFNVKNNIELMEVKRRYREKMQEKNRKVVIQQNQLELNREQNFWLKLTLGIVVLLIISSFLLVKYWYQQRKLKEKNEKIIMKSKLEKEKQEEIINIRNKEITSYTLQLIDKERVVDSLLDELKVYQNEVEYRRTFNTTKDVSKNLWGEFNERFTNVNVHFYSKLQKQFPSLSPTELKHCALIKLRFNGKEMAQLLNISLPSVHVARSRLRKKFGLQREDSLTKFISNI